MGMYARVNPPSAPLARSARPTAFTMLSAAAAAPPAQQDSLVGTAASHQSSLDEEFAVVLGQLLLDRCDAKDATAAMEMMAQRRSQALKCVCFFVILLSMEQWSRLVPSCVACVLNGLLRLSCAGCVYVICTVVGQQQAQYTIIMCFVRTGCRQDLSQQVHRPARYMHLQALAAELDAQVRAQACPQKCECYIVQACMCERCFQSFST